MFSVIVTSYEGDYHLLPRAVASVHSQCVYAKPEIIIVRRGIDTPDNPNMGNDERARGLALATQPYICWLSADNVLFPDYLGQHYTNFLAAPGVPSIVNIHYWKDKYQGIFPSEVNLGYVDLLNFALPTELARRVDAFGGDVRTNCIAPDWRVLQKCLALTDNVYTWNRNSLPCACHF